MRRGLLTLALFLAACGAEEGPLLDASVPDAEGPPRCEDVGCPDVALCTTEGICNCLATGSPVACVR